MLNIKSRNMKQTSSIFTLISLIVILISCNKVAVDKSQKLTNCVFEQNDETMDGRIDETERSIMDECMKNKLSSKSSIEANLIGEWSLIGHGEGWIPSISQPCAHIKISPDQLTFKFQNQFIDTTTINSWEIEEVNSGMHNFFKLNINSEFKEGLWITNFCENYMYGDATPSDGNMYLYEKVK